MKILPTIHAPSDLKKYPMNSCRNSAGKSERRSWQ